MCVLIFLEANKKTVEFSGSPYFTRPRRVPFLDFLEETQTRFPFWKSSALGLGLTWGNQDMESYTSLFAPMVAILGGGQPTGYHQSPCRCLLTRGFVVREPGL